MTRFQRWILKIICRDLVKQGPHERNIREYYNILREAATAEFTEDNLPTLNDFLTECHHPTR
jgi:hypothetical protein